MRYEAYSTRVSTGTSTFYKEAPIRHVIVGESKIDGHQCYETVCGKFIKKAQIQKNAGDMTCYQCGKITGRVWRPDDLIVLKTDGGFENEPPDGYTLSQIKYLADQ